MVSGVVADNIAASIGGGINEAASFMGSVRQYALHISRAKTCLVLHKEGALFGLVTIHGNFVFTDGIGARIEKHVTPLDGIVATLLGLSIR